MGTPICNLYEYCLDKYLEALKIQSMKNDILLVDNSEDIDFVKKLENFGMRTIHKDPSKNRRETVKDCRNFMIDIAIKNNYDYIFFVDADTIPPFDALEKLLFAKKDIVSGVVFNNYQKEGRIIQLPALWTWANPKRI